MFCSFWVSLFRFHITLYALIFDVLSGSLQYFSFVVREGKIERKNRKESTYVYSGGGDRRKGDYMRSTRRCLVMIIQRLLGGEREKLYRRGDQSGDYCRGKREYT